ncbi:MAG: DNA internalization-related competence protein ComEC/Rec2 [Clostridia bacterium]|nr:DNA internalization-related competence protein ComEC/Rec2 [Clostridia bacterium]
MSLYLPISSLALFLVIVIFVAIGILLHRKTSFLQKALFPLLLVLILLFGGMRGAVYNEKENPLKPFIDSEINLQGLVKGAPQVEEDRVIYIIQTSAVKVKDAVYPIQAKIKVSVYPDAYGPEAAISSIKYTGDLLQVSGVLKEPTGPRNPKGFDYKSYLARRNIYSTISIRERNVTLIKEANTISLDRLLASFRNRASEALEKVVGGREGNFLKAVLLGERWMIEPETEDNFTKTGLAHILAISGLHIGYLVVLLNLIRSLFRLRMGPAFIFQAVILILYCLMTGASPSVTRAVIMALIYLGARALGRKTDLINSAGTAAFLILLIRPMDFLEISFQLSFLAVCSIGLFQEPLQNSMSFIPKKVSSLISIGLSTQLGTLPLTTYYFNLISPVSILANLLVLPVLGIVTAGGFLLLLTGMLVPNIASIAALPIKLLCSLIFLVTDFAAGLPYAYFRVVSPSIFTIICAFLFLWMISRERPSFIRHPSLACGALIIVYLTGQLLMGLSTPKELKLVFLDVGQGDCCFIQTPDQKNILIDGGGQEGVDIDEDVLLPFLLKNGYPSLDLVIMSHGHDDHITGLNTVIAELRTKAFMEYPPKTETPIYQELKNTVNRKKVPVITAVRGESYPVGNETWLHILYPNTNAAETFYEGNDNNLSLVILLECGDASVLFTGDIEKGVEYYLTGRMNKQVSILKAAHHGSNTSSTDAFLEVVSPKYAVIQSGVNPFGHPNPNTLERLTSHDVAVYRNDLHGAVMLNYGKDGWVVKTMLDVNEN